MGQKVDTSYRTVCFQCTGPESELFGEGGMIELVQHISKMLFIIHLHIRIPFCITCGPRRRSRARTGVRPTRRTRDGCGLGCLLCLVQIAHLNI